MKLVPCFFSYRHGIKEGTPAELLPCRRVGGRQLGSLEAGVELAASACVDGKSRAPVLVRHGVTDPYDNDRTNVLESKRVFG
jgi:hypothetical protein